jgi:hypothetical protein
MILAGYTETDPAALDALAMHAPGAQRTDTSASLYAYWEAVRRQWDGREDLIIIEQHIIIHGDVLPQFARCRSQWCTFPYEITAPRNWLYEGIGCARFTAALQREVPAAVIEASYGSCYRCTADGSTGRSRSLRPGCWAHLDGEISHVLKQAGFACCVHEPAVLHCKVPRPAAA